MSKPKKSESNVKTSEVKLIEQTPAEPHFLTNDALHLRDVWDKEQSPRDAIPPQTPNSEYAFGDSFSSLPKPFPDLTNLEIPYVREKGVKFCVEELGDYFKCKDYKFDYLQFWFLDAITDCLWKSQDDFHLPVDLQKTVLQWVLHFIDLIRDPQKNMSRKEFFTVFKEAISVAAEIIDEGCDTLPTPEQVFALIKMESKSRSSLGSSLSSSSIDITSDEYDNVSCVELHVDGKERLYELPKEVCTCDNYDLSSVDTIASTNVSHKPSETNQNSQSQTGKLEDAKFYQADDKIPLRFLPLPEELIDESITEEERLQEENEGEGTRVYIVNKNCIMDRTSLTQSLEDTEDHYGVQEVSDKFKITFGSNVSSTTTADRSETILSEQDIERHESSALSQNDLRSSIPVHDEGDILKGLALQKIWEQRLLDMANPKKGWIPTGDDITKENDTEVEREGEEVGEQEKSTSEDEGNDDEDDDDQWVDVILKKRKKKITDIENKQVVNFGVLWAICDFIFKYFYESFQFTLIKLAFQATPDIITQKLNQEWRFPKKIKEPLVKPKEEKPKKPPKKDKKKDKGKKDKKKDKKPKKDKKGKGDKKSKKDKKGKKPKPAKLTKEEKAELERLRKEQERLEEEQRKLEENKRFMFPLTEAATDEFFKNIFENWVKVDLAKKGKKGGKEKGKKKK